MREENHSSHLDGDGTDELQLSPPGKRTGSTTWLDTDEDGEVRLARAFSAVAPRAPTMLSKNAALKGSSKTSPPSRPPGKRVPAQQPQQSNTLSRGKGATKSPASVVGTNATTLDLLDVHQVANALQDLREVNEEQWHELHYAMQLYADSHPQLKLDRHRRLLFRTSVTLEVGQRSTITALVTFIIPAGYPAVGHELEVAVTSRHGNREFLSSITKRLNEEAQAFARNGTASAITNLLGLAKETMADMPPAQLADHYCCCIDCNQRRLRQREAKIPQPALRNDSGETVCLSCGGKNAMLLPMFRSSTAAKLSAQPSRKKWGHDRQHQHDASENDRQQAGAGTTMVVQEHQQDDEGDDAEDEDEDACSFCFTPDQSLLYLACGCISCFECFCHFSDLAIGSKSLAKVPYRGGAARGKFDAEPTPTQLLRELVGIPCPNHKKDPTAIIFYPPLLKLLPPRAFNRYNFFAMETSLAGQPGVVSCPLPQCCSYPFFTDQPGMIVECPFCGDCFCTRCQQPAEGDQCTCTTYADVVRISCVKLAERVGAAALLRCRRQAESIDHNFSTPLPPSTPSVTAMIMMRDKQLPLALPLDGEWFPRVISFVEMSELCPYAQVFRRREQGLYVTFFHGAMLDPEVSLAAQHLFHGAVIFVVETFLADDYTLRKVGDVAHRQFFAAKSNVTNVVHRKKCPTCTKPVLHYLGHGCHMIFGCHPGMPEWCYVCGAVASGHRCPKGCPLFCKFTIEKDHRGRPLITPQGCDCILCPDCKPMRPCDNCTLCPMCTLDGVTSIM